MTNPDTDPIAARYGRATEHLGQGATESGHRRRNVIIIVVVAVIAAVATWLIIDSQRGAIRTALHSWHDPVDGVMPVTVEVDRSPSTALTCQLIAVDARFIVVGQLEFEVPAGEPARQRVAVEIPLRGDGIAPELISCQRQE
ncbi:DUF4307 domain-containing protein [Phytoactinopolyspora limicola]|uniref:DUF4307 domain-containing protein n=1 Tax=Phytoactinopolyspora limicola TaxID=2715536 RepID=UPI001408772A|nr:DUF4307 domain-containing protein [Phytoactinopolyspora limicola]